MFRKGSARAAAFISGLILALMCLATAAMAQGPQIMFILDGSGSMWGRAGGQSKIQAAKQVMEQAVTQAPAEAAVGLAAYGHRRQGDCADVEILAMPGQSGRDALISLAKGITPKGKTPMAASLKLVAAKLAAVDAETTIVLVSDGLETCDPDPCGVVKALKKSGVKFVLHVVGFDVDAKGAAQLSCMAAAGGGRYFAANDAAALLAALQQVNREVAKKIERAKTKTVRAATGLGKLRITMPRQTVVSLAGIKLIRASDGKLIKKAAPAADAVHPLLSGQYNVVLAFANPNYKPSTDAPIGSVTVEPGKTATLALGGLLPNVAQGLGGAVNAVEIRRAGEAKPLVELLYHGNGYYLFKAKPLPAGKYDFYARNDNSPGSVLLAQNVEVVPGKLAVVELDSGIKLKKPQSINISGWDLVDANNETVVVQVRRRWDNDNPLFAPILVRPGVYNLLVHAKDMTEPLPAAQGVEIGKGQTLDFDTGL